MAMTAKECLQLHEMWENASKETIAANVNALFGYSSTANPERHPASRFNRRTAILCALTNTKRYTVLGWFNKCRDEVKVPLLKLCVIADTFDVDIAVFFSETVDWYTGNDKLRARLEEKVESLGDMIV